MFFANFLCLVGKTTFEGLKPFEVLLRILIFDGLGVGVLRLAGAAMLFSDCLRLSIIQNTNVKKFENKLSYYNFEILSHISVVTNYSLVVIKHFDIVMYGKCERTTNLF